MKLLRCSLLLSFAAFALTAAAQPETADCLAKLFVTKPATAERSKTTLILPGGKRSSLNAFWKANYMEPYGKTGLYDLDGDGKKELLLSNFTGGAHCCDELFVFKQTGSHQYLQTARLAAGNTCFADSLFVFDLHELFGYFFTCYACYLQADGKHKGLQEVGTVSLRYTGGKINVVPGTEALRQRLLKNLAYLKKLGPDGGVKEGEFDDGRRKELALNLAVYHFSCGQNLDATKEIFATHYPWKDAASVWKEFVGLLNNAKKNMSL